MCTVKIEEWRPVSGFEGLYEVSSSGRVRSLDRVSRGRNGASRRGKGRVLNPSWDGLYHRTVLSDAERRKSVRVHVLVAAAFHGDRSEGAEVRHLDGNPKNNKAENLAYGSSQQNSDDCARHGNFRRGLDHQNCFIPDELVVEILALPRGSRKPGQETIGEWADRHGISRGHVYNIRNGRRRK